MKLLHIQDKVTEKIWMNLLKNLDEVAVVISLVLIT